MNALLPNPILTKANFKIISKAIQIEIVGLKINVAYSKKPTSEFAVVKMPKMK